MDSFLLVYIHSGFYFATWIIKRPSNRILSTNNFSDGNQNTVANKSNTKMNADYISFLPSKPPKTKLFFSRKLHKNYTVFYVRLKKNIILSHYFLFNLQSLRIKTLVFYVKVIQQNTPNSKFSGSLIEFWISGQLSGGSLFNRKLNFMSVSVFKHLPMARLWKLLLWKWIVDFKDGCLKRVLLGAKLVYPSYD